MRLYEKDAKNKKYLCTNHEGIRGRKEKIISKYN